MTVACFPPPSPLVLTHAHAGVPLDKKNVVVTFAMVSEAARRFNETAIGYRLSCGKTVLVLAPSPSATMTLQPGDKIVVLAQGFQMGN